VKCKSCNIDNPSGMKFCKKCGTPLDVSLKTCANGHNYDTTLVECPYCPKKDYAKTVIQSDQGDSRTIVPREGGSSRRGDKTVIDNSPPTLSSSSSGGRRERTTIVNDDGSPAAASAPAGQPLPRLVGWLVTFDLQASGTDYRIYEGRTRIGSAASNDIVITRPGVSDMHAMLLYRDDQFILRDELSTNGTIVNGKTFEGTLHVADNDLIRIGSVTFKLKVI